MNHQYWLTKNAKKLQRKFNAKEDEHIVSSDNELDLKIELFKSINESSNNLCNLVEKYKDQIQTLCQEQQNLGKFLRDFGKNSNSSSSVMVNSGKVISYLGQQHMTLQTSLFRTLSELNTFKRAINDTKQTIKMMETDRTEYRASLSLMKSCSADIDPDSGRGIEKFRTAQQYVKFSKVKFDKSSLACLQKIDLLAAARCNLFSYSLASYQTNWMTLCQKNEEMLKANIKIIQNEPKKNSFGILKAIGQEIDNKTNGNDDSSNVGAGSEILKSASDGDQRLFFESEFIEEKLPVTKNGEEKESLVSTDVIESSIEQKLIDYEKDFDEFMSAPNMFMPSQLLMNENYLSNDNNTSEIDLLGSLSTNSINNNDNNNQSKLNKNPSKKNGDVSKWFQLFSELDPLNQQNEVSDASKNLHAA